MVNEKLMDSYELTVNDILIDVTIVQTEEEPIPTYNISITNISDTTKIILDKIREEFVESSIKALNVTSEGFTIENIQDEFRKNKKDINNSGYNCRQVE